MRDFVLAIDSGGTKCEALLVDSTGVAIGHGRCDPASRESGRGFYGCGRAPETIAAAARQALASLPEDRDRARVIVCGPAVKVWLGSLDAIGRADLEPGGSFGEEEPALFFTGETDAVVALSGTGSFVWGRNADGQALRLDALGPVLGDFGSASDIGLRALRLAVRASWDPRIVTSLSTEILAACGMIGGSLNEGLEWRHLTGSFGDRSELAALAAVVDREARRGDIPAREILEAAASDLAENCRALIERLDIARGDHALIGTGGVIARSDIFWNGLQQRVLAVAPRFRPMRSCQAPVAGFALLQLQELIPGDPEQLKRRLLESYATLTHPRESLA